MEIFLISENCIWSSVVHGTIGVVWFSASVCIQWFYIFTKPMETLYFLSRQISYMFDSVYLCVSMWFAFLTRRFLIEFCPLLLGNP